MVLSVLLFAFIAFPLKASGQTTRHITIGYKITGINSSGYSVSGFPASTRAIPRHPDDTWIKDLFYANNVLADTSFNIGSQEIRYSVVYVSLYDIFSVGFSLVNQLEINKAVDPPYRFDQNQFGNHIRGYGNSLRYYEMAVGHGVHFGLYASLGSPIIKIYKNQEMLIGFRPFIEGVYQLRGSKTQVTSGWDRFDEDEAWQTKTVGEVRQHYLNLGLEFHLMNIDRSVGIYLSTGYAQSFVIREGSILYDGPSKRADFMIGVGIKYSF